MALAQYDVVVVGAGCAGWTAALGLARAGFTVAVVEAAKGASGAGMLGDVCSAESLFQPDILGAKEVETLAWERRLIERGCFVTDGQRLIGYTYRDKDAFRSCYIILRSRFSQKLAETSQSYGVVLYTETAVEGLIRDGRRIIGVATPRGPLYARLVFLAEGDAGLLLSREGLNRFKDPPDQPSFLYCLQQIFELPPGAIEERFHVEIDQGVAYDFLLRNPATMPLNARGLLYTNRQGLTLSVVLPLVNLQRWFNGKPRQLLDWFAEMPVLRPWLRESRPGTWTAALLRTGGLREVPYLVEDGLAIGGAAAGLGTDFPVLNLMAPALATAMVFSRAVVRIRAEGHSFDREALARHYLGPLQQTRYWQDMEFVQRWPGYLVRGHVLFRQGFDLLLDSASVWARGRRWLPWKFWAWLYVLARVSGRQGGLLRDELLQLSRALRWHEVMPRPALARLLLDGSLNTFRDLVRQPRPHVPPHGTLHLHYHTTEEREPVHVVPWLFRRWFERFRPVLAAAGHIFHTNEDIPLSVKWRRTFDLFLRQANLFDVLAVAGLALPIALMSMTLAVGRHIFTRIYKINTEELYQNPLSDKSNSEISVPEGSAYPAPPLIHIAWRSTQPEQQAASVRLLPHVCPTHVFEIRGTPPETVQVTVHTERCIFCHACWQTSSLVSWDYNGSFLPSFADRDTVPQDELGALLNQLERKLGEFDATLAQGPALVDRPHNDYLEMLARYAQQLASRIRELLNTDLEMLAEIRQPALEWTDDLLAHAKERTRHVWEGQLARAVAEGQLLRQHHLVQLRRLLAVPIPTETAKPMPTEPLDWLSHMPPVPREDAAAQHLLADSAAQHYLLEALAQRATTTNAIQDELLAALAVDVRDRLSVNMQESLALIKDTKDCYNIKYPCAAEETYKRCGGYLCENEEKISKLLDTPGDWARIAQLQVLRAEREELMKAERRLLALLADGRRSLSLSDDLDKGRSAYDALNAGLGRQAAHILGGKQLLLHTFAHLEKGHHAELATLLLRVWLDYAATLLDEYALMVHERLHPRVYSRDRPFVEPDSGAPLRTQTEYLNAPATYRSGDFLLAPLDLLQPRLVPEIVCEKEIVVTSPAAAALMRLIKNVKYKYSNTYSGPDLLYSMEALAVEIMGRYAVTPSAEFDLESACARLVLLDPHRLGGARRERSILLQALSEVVIPRWLRGDLNTRVRHLERDVLELEALKADFRSRLTTAWQVFGPALGRNAEVQASCFALAEAAAWLKAADSTLGRMAWLSRLCQVDDREEPPSQRYLAPRALAHCFAEVRNRLFRFDEDLAALRRGYYAPHVYAAAWLLQHGPRLGLRVSGNNHRNKPGGSL